MKLKYIISGMITVTFVVVIIAYQVYFRYVGGQLLFLNTGDVIEYDVRYHSEAEVKKGFFGSNIKAKNLLTEFNGSLQFQVVERKGGGYKLLGRLRSDKFINGLISNDPQVADWSFLFRWTESGLIEYIDMLRKDLEVHSYVIADVLSQVHFDYQEGNEWSAHEEKRYGSVTVLYHKIFNGMGLTVNKLIDQGNKRFKVRQNVQLKVGFGGFPTEINASRERKFFSDQGVMSSDKLTFSLVKASRSRETVGAAPAPNSLFRDTLLLTNLSDLARQEKVRKRMQDLSPTALQQAIEISQENETALTDLSFIVAAYLEFAPDAVENVVLNDLNVYSWTDPRFDIYVQNLRYVGNIGSQRILVKAIESEWEFRKKAQLMVSLGLVENPSASSFEFMEGLSKSSDIKISEQAELMLGSMVELSNLKFSRTAVRVKTLLEKKLADAQTNIEKQHYLDAVGNMGKQASFESLLPFLESSDLDVKLEAIDSLRLMETDQADAYLVTLMQDAEVKIRHAAVEALSYQVGNEEVYIALLKRLLDEDNTGVMKLVIMNLAQFDQYRSRTKNALQSFIARCGVTALCNYAKSKVAGL